MEFVTHFRGLINIVRRSGSDGRLTKRQMTRRAAAAVLRRFPEWLRFFTSNNCVVVQLCFLPFASTRTTHFPFSSTLDKFIRMLHGEMEMEINLFLGRKLIYVPFSCGQSEICCDSLNSFSSHFWRLLRRWNIYVGKTKKKECRKSLSTRHFTMIYRTQVGRMN